LRAPTRYPRRIALLLLTATIFFAVVSGTWATLTSSEPAKHFSFSSSGESTSAWHGCEVDPRNNRLTQFQIKGRIVGTLSDGEKISILSAGSDFITHLEIEALGPIGDTSSQVQLTLFPTANPDHTNVLLVPLINRSFLVQLKITGESGSFSVGKKPNTVQVPFILSDRLDCSQVGLSSKFVTQEDSLITADVRVDFSQSSLTSEHILWPKIDARIFLAFLVMLSILMIIRFLQKKNITLPDGQKLTSMLTVQLAASIPVLWMLGSYFNFDVFGSFVYTSADGWCRSAIEGIGDHCFGDWNERIAPNFFDHQYPSFSSSLETSPIGPYLTSAFNYLTTVTSPRTTLYFALLLAFFLGLLAVKILTESSLSKQLVLFALVLVGGYPWLVAADRIHLSIFVLPVFAFTVRGAIQNNRVVLGRSLLALACFKPHFAIFLLVFANARDWKFLVKYSALSVAGVLALLGLPSASPINRIYQYVMNLLYMSDYRPSGTTSYPPNISIRRMLEILLSPTHLEINQLFVLSLMIAATGILLTVFLGSKGYFHALLRLMPLVILGFNGYVATYYLLFSSIVLLTALSPSLDVKSTIAESLAHSRLAIVLFVIAIIASQSLIIIPYGDNHFGGILTLTPLIAAFFWVALSLYLITLDTLRYLKYRSKALHE
jgi:hypothetical protein